jgi:amidohydrolase
MPGLIVRTDCAKALSGDDFAEFLRTVPGVYALIGSRDPLRENTGLPLHSSRLDIDEDAIVTAASLYAAVALYWLKEVI